VVDGALAVVFDHVQYSGTGQGSVHKGRGFIKPDPVGLRACRPAESVVTEL
jgi:hypothetical protein